MIDKAIEKITKEAMEINNPFAFFLEEHLTEMCTSNAVAEKLLAEGKSLRQICTRIENRMRKEAQEANSGKRSAVWGAPDAVFYEEVEKYYGIDQKSKSASVNRVNVLDLF